MWPRRCFIISSGAIPYCCACSAVELPRRRHSDSTMTVSAPAAQGQEEGGNRLWALFRLYGRVILLLGSDLRVGVMLAVGNVALVAAQFAEPVLFGRIVDSLASTQAKQTSADWSVLVPLLAAWVAFGLFAIVAGTLIGLYSDRLSHRRR